ncbi:MAG: carbohydrate kinase family protein [Anaerolineae bacterium]|nr:carbohydrate kinase family protein [Anaerolineae bacterium]
MDVIGVGDADVDIYLDVDHLPGRDEKVLADGVNFHPGGMVANFLVALSQLGTPCGFHGTVGDDEFGRMVLTNMAANGVATDGAVVKPGGRTYFCVVMLDDTKEKALVVAPTDCIFPEPDDVSAQWIKQAKHLHTTAANVSTALKSSQIAKQFGLTVSIDIEPDASRQNANFQLLLSQVDIAFVNQRAVETLGKTDSLEAAARNVLDAGPKLVCVTMGGQGSLVISAAESHYVDAFPVEVVDSTGAGDYFAAGFVHAFLQGWSLQHTATLASALGALGVTQRGGQSDPPTMSEAVAFLADRGIAII